MGRRLATLPIWIALAAYFLTGILSARGLQVCLEEDGHVALEVQGQECGGCCPLEHEADEGTHLDACPCVDVPIGSPDAPLPKTKATDSEGLDALAALPCSRLGGAALGAARGLAPVRGRACGPRTPARRLVLRV